MEKEEIRLILEKQRSYFAAGQTLEINCRLKNLKKLKKLIIENAPEIRDALWKDFHKPACEVISSEIQFVIKELNLAIRKLGNWSKVRRIRTPLIHFIAQSYISPQPYGQVLVLSPWNFPFQLAMLPAMSALAAGNCVILRISQQVPEISRVIEKILSNFPSELIAAVNGDHAISEYLLDYKFDYIFFTGSSKIGRYVLGKAAVNLTPVSLELGGKNPCVVAADSRLDFAARRIAWGKFYNGGQTCVCPDYLLIDRKIRDAFLDLLKKEIRKFYGENPENSPDLPRVISSASARRLASLMADGEIVTGGICIPEKKYVAPTIIKGVRPGDPIMQEEVFGPVLPVIDYENIDDVYSIIEQNPQPLAVYIFTRNKKLAHRFLERTRSGSSAINDTIIQFATPYLPFGGVGRSGMGRYHGRASFETFSNMRSLMIKSNLMDIFVRYPPYTRFKEKVFNVLMR
ncbi:MAG: aldehyde dehydrogenase family protein [Bacteroidales bacterium]|jgi:acyl-CoA reductase-like NAD-dependent aldehyde dehydrogenase